ncbi:MAG: hypothetical protein KDD82_24695, partial [Planctomycetes bacterium]|nr:hypothetical protein [Planctomycetota bacterium]
MLEATLEGHPATLKALLGGDRAEWEELLEHLQAHPDALPSQECVRSLIFEERSLRRWLEVARDAAFEVHVSFASDPDARARLFAAWLLRGVAAQLSGLAVHDRAGLEVELGLCRLQEGLGVGDPLAEGRELVERLRRAWGEATHELPRALLLW